MRRISPILLLALGACTVGPDYAGPTTKAGMSPAAAFARAGADGVDRTEALSTGWWHGLGDPMLDDLETRALAGNPGIAVAHARLEKARSGLRLERASTRPNMSATGLYLHGDLPPSNLGIGSGEGEQEGSGSAGRSSIDLYNVGFDASWELDLFGGQRRKVEAAQAASQAAEANLADAQLSLSAEVARAYVSLRERQQRIQIARQIASLREQSLTLLQQRVDAGTANHLDLEQQRQQVENAQAALLPLEAERDAYLNALAVLTGTVPGALDQMLAPLADIPLPPAQVPVGDPASLIARRPDIRAAERTLASQTARIGVAQAARFPKISFMGVIGLGGSNADDILDPDNLSLLILPRLQWNFLDLGRNSARVAQARADSAEAAAQYDQSVLRALEDAETALARFGAQRKALASAERVRRSAVRSQELVTQRYQAGAARLSDMLDAQGKRISAEDGTAMARSALSMHFIALQKALGLGWQ